jgi:hypothetical protein
VPRRRSERRDMDPGQRDKGIVGVDLRRPEQRRPVPQQPGAPFLPAAARGSPDEGAVAPQQEPAGGLPRQRRRLRRLMLLEPLRHMSGEVRLDPPPVADPSHDLGSDVADGIRPQAEYLAPAGLRRPSGHGVQQREMLPYADVDRATDVGPLDDVVRLERIHDGGIADAGQPRGDAQERCPRRLGLDRPDPADQLRDRLRPATAHLRKLPPQGRSAQLRKRVRPGQSDPSRRT